MQQDKANLSDLVKLFKTNSIAEFESQLIKGEEAKVAREQQAQESQNEGIQMQIEADKEESDLKHQRELEVIDRKGEWDIRKAVTTGAGFAEDKDADGDGVLDIVEIGKQQTDLAKNNNELMDRQQSRSFESTEKAKDRQLERDKMKSQEKMNAANNKVALKNKVVGEK